MINSGALGSIMTGSGSAVFGIFESDKKIKECADKFNGQMFCQICQPDRGKTFRSKRQDTNYYNLES